jgi:serine/threonine-protein kinase
MSGAVPRDALHTFCLADPLWNERYEGWIELGQGGSACVVRTHSRALDEDLALKIFPRLAADDWKRFQEEVRNAQRLTSPYVVRTYSPFPRGSFAWIEQELIDGPNLRQELERRQKEQAPYGLEEFMEIAVAVTSALATAHEAGIIHRDVKPANILLPKDRNPVAKLGDFGISRVTGAARLTKTGLLAGTPQFAAPEVIAGLLGGPPSDVYSLSLCLYLVLSNNRFPFEVRDDSSPTQWMRAHTDQKPRPIQSVNSAVPEEVAELINAGLAKEPERRPTVAEILECLTRLRGLPAAARPRRRRMLLHLGSMSLGAVVAAVVTSSAWMWRGDADRPLPSSVERGPGAAMVPVPSPTPASLALVDPAPASPTPLPTPTPAATLPAQPAPEAPAVRASIIDNFVTIRNMGRAPITNARITLFGRSGHRYAGPASAEVDPDQELSLNVDTFSPTPAPADLQGARVQVAPRGQTPVTVQVRH